MKGSVEDVKVERRPCMKPDIERVTTYSFPGQYITSSALTNKLFNDFNANKRACQYTGKKTNNVVVFDPNTKKTQYNH